MGYGYRIRNITNQSYNSWVFLNISYTNAQLGSLTESSFIIARHNGSWDTTPLSFASQTGIDATNNFVFANITSFRESSIFAILNDVANPVSLLISPVNNSISASATVSFICNMTDNLQLSNVSFYTDMNGSWYLNITNVTSGTANYTIFTILGMPNGTYTWNCLAKDITNHEAFNSTNYTINIDTGIPSDITLNAPGDAINS
jgi:hypothetical protein